MHLLLVTGYLIIVVIRHTYSGIVFIFSTIVEVVNVLIEDFQFFRGDIVNFGKQMWICISDSFNTILESFQGITILSSSPRKWGRNIPKFCDVEILGYTFKCVHELILGALSLIGSGTRCIFQCTVNFVTFIPQMPCLVYDYFKKKCACVAHYISDLATQEAAIGLLVVIASIILGYRSNFHKVVSSKSLLLMKKSCRYLTAFLSSVLTTSLGLFRRRHKHFRSFSKSTCSTYDLEKKLEQEIAEKLCIICMDNRRNRMFVGCNHLVLCSSCADSVFYDSGMCPVCRTSVVGMVDVYT